MTRQREKQLIPHLRQSRGPCAALPGRTCNTTSGETRSVVQLYSRSLFRQEWRRRVLLYGLAGIRDTRRQDRFAPGYVHVSTAHRMLQTHRRHRYGHSAHREILHVSTAPLLPCYAYVSSGDRAARA
eukprot:3864787-Rhodomonas_salina.2